MELMEMVDRLREKVERGEISETEFDQAHKNILYGWGNVDDDPSTAEHKTPREH